jgi:hypothetical protein
LPLFAAGERAWCQRCERTGYRRRRLGVTRSPGLIACGHCWRAHERAGIWPSRDRPHDPDSCRLCTPWATPDDDPGLDPTPEDRVSLRERCDAQVAERRQAEREAQRWREQASRTREAITAGRPVLLVAAALRLQERARTSARGRPSLGGHVAAMMAVSGERRSGNRARPGRACTAQLVGISEQAVTVHWRHLERLGWCTRTVRGGAVSFRRRIVEGHANDRAEWRIALPHRILTGGGLTGPGGLLDRATAVLTELAERAEALADAAQVRAEAVAAELVVLGAPQARPAELHRCNLLLPPGGTQGSNQSSCYLGFVLPAHAIIARYVPGSVRPSGRGGASRPAAARTRRRSPSLERPRKPYRMCPRALDLARALCAPDGLILAVRRAPVVQVAAVLRRFAGWTVEDVLAAAEARLVARGAGRTWTPPNRARRPAAWLRWLLADADPVTPPVQVRRASELQRAEQLRAAAEVARVGAMERVKTARGAGGEARQLARAVAARAGQRRSAWRRPDVKTPGRQDVRWPP